ncbi:MAG: hypothetical protein JWO12_388 [Frankiales bacterium]|nr:hypothetical protein [Frankiales bacterium]
MSELPMEGSTMSLTSLYATITTHDGYCNGCCDDVTDERPLMVMARGPRGLRAWLAGVGAEDRALSYTCLTCGRVEHVPHTEAEDDEYAATLVTWPDWSPAELPLATTAVVSVTEPVAVSVTEPVAVPVAVPLVVLPSDVFALAAERLQPPAPVISLPAARKPLVRVFTLPVQRVHATDDQLLALSA